MSAEQMCFQVLFRVNKSSGSEFQTVGSETEKARLPDMLHWTSGRDSWWRLAYRRCWRPRYFRHRHTSLSRLLRKRSIVMASLSYWIQSILQHHTWPLGIHAMGRNMWSNIGM